MFKITVLQSHLLSAWNVLNTIKNQASDTVDLPTEVVAETPSQLSRVEQMLGQQTRQFVVEGTVTMEKKLRRIPLEDAVPLRSDIITWWELKKKEDPNLVLLCQTALSTPCTQVSIERGFSGLAKVLTNDRTKLSAENLRKILFVKLNNVLFEDTYFNYGM